MFNIDTCIAFITNRASKKLADAFNKRLSNLGITRVQWTALYYLGQQEGLNQKELGILMNIKGSTVARLIDRLEKENYVERKQDPEDRRKTNLHLTTRGRRLRDKIIPEGEKMSQICSQGITEEEMETFRQVLKKMVTNIEKSTEND